MKIRFYQQTDEEALINILRTLVPRYFAREEVTDFRKYLETSLEDYYVVEIDNTIVGAGGINYNHEEGLATLSWDFIRSTHHGRGIGRLLVAHRLQRIATHENISKIQVRTSQHTNLFYEKQGFVLQEIIEDYWSPGYHLYYMVYDS